MGNGDFYRHRTPLGVDVSNIPAENPLWKPNMDGAFMPLHFQTPLDHLDPKLLYEDVSQFGGCTIPNKSPPR